jgi:hypothetical protein
MGLIAGNAFVVPLPRLNGSLGKSLRNRHDDFQVLAGQVDTERRKDAASSSRHCG